MNPVAPVTKYFIPPLSSVAAHRPERPAVQGNPTCAGMPGSDARARAPAAFAAGEARRALRRASAKTCGPAWASSARASSSGRPKPSSAARRSASIVSWGKLAEALGDLQRALEMAARRRRPR